MTNLIVGIDALDADDTEADEADEADDTEADEADEADEDELEVGSADGALSRKPSTKTLLVNLPAT